MKRSEFLGLIGGFPLLFISKKEKNVINKKTKKPMDCLRIDEDGVLWIENDNQIIIESIPNLEDDGFWRVRPSVVIGDRIINKK